jgi:predicted DsbA family dithiol-disulfide isomerase
MLQKSETIYFIREREMPTKNEISEFSEMIENKFTEGNDVNIMDTIVHYCETTGMEIDVASTLISPALKAKIREEAENLNMMKKSAKLPL